MMFRPVSGLRRAMAILLCAALLCAGMPVQADTGAGSLASAPLSKNSGTTNGMVRVYLSSLGSPAQLDITISGSYTVNGQRTLTLQSGSTAVMRYSSASGTMTLTANGSTTDMGSSFKLRRHATGGSNGLKIKQARKPANLYPGDLTFDVVKTSGGGHKLYVVAYIFIEDYLKGVLPYEMGASSPLEALKAQAVCARTYALRNMLASAAGLYDMTDSASTQVFSGVPSDTSSNSYKAVEATRGVVVMNGGALTGTYFSASNGGQIESAQNAWGSSSYNYIVVKDDPYDYDNPDSKKMQYTVYRSFSSNTALMQRLINAKAQALFGACTVKTIDSVIAHTPRYTAPSRLYTKLDMTLTAQAGGISRTGTITFDIFAELENELAMDINTSSANELWSVVTGDTTYVLQARRYGHGIGMSQRGAMYMAKLGYTYDQILAFYFQGCKRVQHTFTSSILSAVLSGDIHEETTVNDPVDIEDGDQCTAIVVLGGNDAKLPMRAQASTGSDVLLSLPNSAPVVVYRIDGAWCLVRYGEMIGLVQRSALNISGTPTGKDAQVTQLVGYGTTKSGLNIRLEMSTGSKTLGTIPAGTIIPLIRVNGDWAYTQYGAINGYVMVSYLTRSGSYPGTVTDPDAVGALTNTNAPFRYTASSTGYAIATLPRGTEVAMQNTDGAWVCVKYNGMTGYILSSQLTPTGQATAQSDIYDTLRTGEYYAYAYPENTLLNMRLEGNDSAQVINKLGKNVMVIVTGRGTTWTSIRYLGVPGYVMTKYLRFNVTNTPTPPPSAASTPVSSLRQAVVTTKNGSLNLRASKSGSAKVLDYIPKGTVITLLSVESDWCATTYNGKSGYVMTKFLTFVNSATPTPQAATATPTAAPVLPIATATPTANPQGMGYARVTTSGGTLNLRKAAKSGSKILITIPYQTVVTVLSRLGVWTGVRYGSYVGYVMTVYLTFIDDQSQPPAATRTPTPTPTSAPAGNYARVQVSSGSTLNLRKTAYRYAKVLYEIPQGTVIPVLGGDSEWVKTTYNGVTGYVMRSFLVFLSEEPQNTPTTPTQAPQQQATATPAPSGRYMRVQVSSGSTLNLRSKASQSAKVLKQIPQGTVLEVLGRSGSWTKTAYEGLDGYVMTKYLVNVSSDAAPTPTKAPAAPTAAPDAAPTKAPASTVAPPSLEGDRAIVHVTSGSTVNLRSYRSDSARVLQQIPNGTLLVVTKRESIWCQTSYNGDTGYVMTKFLRFDGALNATATPAPTGYDQARDATLITLSPSETFPVLVVSDTSTLSLRAGCSNYATILTQIPRGEYVLVVARGETWCEVQYEGKQGFCMTISLDFAP